MIWRHIRGYFCTPEREEYGIMILLAQNPRQQSCLAATSWRIIQIHGSKSKCPCGTLPHHYQNQKE